jgi:hypothetical protein
MGAEAVFGNLIEAGQHGQGSRQAEAGSALPSSRSVPVVPDGAFVRDLPVLRQNGASPQSASSRFASQNAHPLRNGLAKCELQVAQRWVIMN